ncbi:glycosyltransferase family 4 protein [Rhodocytophaga rosea]|uniref:Glycosyltransferase family 4 protein n=1 Tax=Rhodocytophaga rosea TaxID=2704465 RepID=A0A6C0GSX5_9BACT|nr:glycosyltransferase family 4 protein [Rhodocytophaga rosea]QHT71249.1 glycosyltransferase family 4 protein [Rhodocytophaga rosea]
MKIIYIHQYFKTYADGGSSRSYYLAKALIKQGHQVEMITSHNKKAYQKVRIEGITVHYLPVFYDTKLGFLGRILSFLRFVIQASRLALSIKNAGLCYATSTPLTVGITALLLKKLKNIPFYFEVRDLWPQAPIEMGVIRNGFIQKIIRGFEKLVYRQAQKIIALSPGMAQDISQKITDLGKIHVIPNMADCDFFQADEPTFPQKTNTFTISYFGAVGKVNQLNYLVEAARYFQEKQLSGVRFQVVGKGNANAQVQQLAQQYQLNNMTFHPHVDKFTLREMLAHTDAVYISFAQKPVMETSSPNKFFDALAAGKLCITNTSGWVRESIEEADCGFYASPDEPDDFYKKLLPYLASKRKLKEAKSSARYLAETQFSREILTKTFVGLFPQSKPIAISKEVAVVPE